MKHFFILCLVACAIGTNAMAQGVTFTGKVVENNSIMFFGPGMGLDYGGLVGGKFEFLPTKNVGLFAGGGYNLLSLGWNVGGSFKFKPDDTVSPTACVMYGYNAVMKVTGASQYNATSYGVTFGGGVDWKVGSRGDKVSFNLFLPIHSSGFKDKYDAARDNSALDFKNELLPIAISAGYNFTIR